jgi:hypothetical protein
MKEKQNFERGNILRILPQLGDGVCLSKHTDRIVVAIPTYGNRGITGYSTLSIGLNSHLSIAKRKKGVSPEGTDEQVFNRAVEANYLNPQMVAD